MTLRSVTGTTTILHVSLNRERRRKSFLWPEGGRYRKFRKPSTQRTSGSASCPRSCLRSKAARSVAGGRGQVRECVLVPRRSQPLRPRDSAWQVLRAPGMPVEAQVRKRHCGGFLLSAGGAWAQPCSFPVLSHPSAAQAAGFLTEECEGRQEARACQRGSVGAQGLFPRELSPPSDFL